MFIYNKVLQKFNCWVKMIHVFVYVVIGRETNYLISALFNKTAQLKYHNIIHDVHSENKIDAQKL